MIGTIAGFATCLITLWLSLRQGNTDFLDASMKAIAAGVAVVLFTLLINGIIEKLGGTS
jgi:hypothetical protein